MIKNKALINELHRMHRSQKDGCMVIEADGSKTTIRIKAGGIVGYQNLELRSEDSLMDLFGKHITDYYHADLADLDFKPVGLQMESILLKMAISLDEHIDTVVEKRVSKKMGDEIKPTETSSFKYFYGSGSQQVYLLNYGATIIGRSADCDIVLVDRFISRKHARITIDQQASVIDNLSSTNALKVDEYPITNQQPLRPGAVIEMGPYQFKFFSTQESIGVLFNLSHPNANNFDAPTGNLSQNL
ncbi:MAG: FHA domain-containing protein [Verrucomicrobiota bacterium]